MKNTFQYTIVFTVMFSCCYRHTDFAGTYTRYAKHEFGTEYDTIQISLQTKNSYLIERRWQYVRILDAVQLQPEYKIIRTTAYEDDGTLKEEETGAIYVMDPKERVIYNRTVKYKKQ